VCHAQTLQPIRRPAASTNIPIKQMTHQAA
jgi:hypothetical protein